MNKGEIKTKTFYPERKSPYFEEWHSEEDKNVLLRTPDDLRLTTQKAILQPYLKQIKEKIVTHEADEQRREKLRASYKIALEKAKILISKNGDVLKKKISGDIVLSDKKYYETDEEGNMYASDDI